MFITVACLEIRTLHEQPVKPCCSCHLSVVGCRAWVPTSDTVLAATYGIMQSGGGCVAGRIEYVTIRCRHYGGDTTRTGCEELALRALMMSLASEWPSGSSIQSFRVEVIIGAKCSIQIGRQYG